MITYDLFPKIDLLSRNGIRRWRNRVGAAEANKVTRRSASIGTHVHNNIEKWLLGQDNYSESSYTANQLANTVIDHLKENLTVVHGIEHQMYSDQLRAAGTADLIGVYKGQRAIIDFKTSRKIKDEKHITSYYLQGAGYAQMVLERHDVIVPNIVIIMVSLENELKVFERPVSQWSGKISNFFNHFHAGRLPSAN